MFFNEFSYIYIYRDNDVFVKQKNICSFYIDSGRSTCCYFVGFSYDHGNTRFSSGAVLMNPFEDFNENIIGIGGSQDLKTTEIPVPK